MVARDELDRDPDSASQNNGYLGSVSGVRCSVAINSKPWTLGIDTLVISVGARGVGGLGAAVSRQFPSVDWPSIDLTEISPDEPGLVELHAPEEAEGRSGLRRMILATARDPQLVPDPRLEAPATLEAASRATRSAVRSAAEKGSHVLGLPLLGAGAIGFSPSDAAAAIVPAACRELTAQAPSSLHQLIFVCVDEATRRAIERVWGYRSLLATAREQALISDVIKDEARQAKVGEEDLRKAVDVEDELLWQPCLRQLMELRRIDAERDDLRTRLVSSLDLQREVLQPEVEAPGPGPRAARRSGSGQRSRVLLEDLDRQIEEALEKDQGWHELEQRRKNAVRQLVASLLDQSLFPRLRLLINSRLQEQRQGEDLKARREQFRRTLKKVDTRGLRGQPNAEALVPTAAHAELEGLMDPSRLPRASVGVAGPRGCGKSTLLQGVIDRWNSGLSVLVQAPANYVPREFLLYLYGEICEKVLESDRSVPSEAAPPARLRSVSLLGLVIIPTIVLVAGIGMLVAWVSSITSLTEEYLTALGGTVAVIAAVPLILLVVQQLAEPSPSSSSGGPLPGLLVLRKRLGWHLPGVWRLLAVTVACGVLILLAAFGVLTPRRTAGTALLVAAVGTGVFWQRSRPSEEAPSTGDQAGLTGLLGEAQSFTVLMAVAAAQLLAIVAAGVLLAFPANEVALDAQLLIAGLLIGGGCVALVTGVRWRTLLERETRRHAAPPTDPARARAAQDLARIRYQRSVMSGWTGTLKLAAGPWLPFGIDAGMSGSTTEADVPLGVPEIVKGIKALLPVRGPAVVAIDELDKLESVEKAREFLNEIKGVLDAPNTRFLVSMSDDAIASFERRGLPFRDVFDSAFDEVVRVPYLTVKQARMLLDGRVTDVPVPFLVLAYCQSGGLPRDLLRATDRILSLAGRDGAALDLAAVTRHVVHQDLAGKTEAVTSAIKSIGVEPHVSDALRCFQSLDKCAPGGPRRVPCLLDDNWLKGLEQLNPILLADDSDDVSDRRELLRLTVELVGYFFYCRTLLELFDASTDDGVDRLMAAVTQDDGLAVDELARARQNFAVNPFVAWDQVCRLRTAQQLEPFDLPTPLVVSSRPSFGDPGKESATRHDKIPATPEST